MNKFTLAVLFIGLILLGVGFTYGVYIMGYQEGKTEAVKWFSFNCGDITPYNSSDYVTNSSKVGLYYDIDDPTKVYIRENETFVEVNITE